MAGASSLSRAAFHRLDGTRCEGLPVSLQPASSCIDSGPWWPSVPASRFSLQWGGGNEDGVGWGNQHCAAIKLSFLSPSNRLPFPWFSGSVVLLVGLRGPFTFSLSPCPIYGNEPSALSVTAAQIEEWMGGGGSMTDKSLRQRHLPCCVCLSTRGCLQTRTQRRLGEDRRP